MLRRQFDSGMRPMKIGYRRTRHAKPCKDMRYVCQVCGDVAFGYNFNAITCESCKSFFRRQAQTPSVLLTCANMSECKITKETRKHCPACRMKKCEAVGMSKLRIPVNGYDKQQSYDSASDDSPCGSLDTEQLMRMPLKERYKAARRILDDIEMVPNGGLSKSHQQIAEAMVHCGSQMVAPFAMPDPANVPEGPFSLERLMYAQQIERRFVAALKACPDFTAFDEKEQLEVLKRGMLNYHNLVSAFYVDVSSASGGWHIPLADREALWVPKEVIYGHFEKAGVDTEIESFFKAYRNLAASLRSHFGGQWTAVQFALTVVQLFSPFTVSVPGALSSELVTSTFEDSSTMTRCLSLHYKYVSFLQAYCEYLDAQQRALRPELEQESNWSFCLGRLLEIQSINRQFVQALSRLASSREASD